MVRAHRFFLLAVLGALVIGIPFAVLWLEHRLGVTLPVPTGPFAVGRTMCDWVDELHSDTLAPRAGIKRELLVWIWYPAMPAQPDSTVESYLPASTRAEVEHGRGVLLGKLLTRDLSKVQGHSLRAAAISSQRRSYPVLIMRAGASAEVWNYSTLAEDLASHGYVVLGFDAPYRTSEVVFPDGRVARRLPKNNPELCLEMAGAERRTCVNRVLTAWTGDIAFALDRLQQLNADDPSGRFSGRLDLAHTGVFGHSFGGAAAAQFCSQDPRCKAGVDIDGALQGSVLETGIHQPFLFLMGDHSRDSDSESRQILADIHSVYDRLPTTGRALIEIRGANHYLFSDDSALLKSHIVLGALRTFGVLRIEGRRQLAVTAYCLRMFFDAYLKEPVPSPPKFTSHAYPEVGAVD